MFIVLEGIDGSGKSSNLEGIKQFLKEKYPEKDVIFTREPGGKNNPLGEKIRELVLNNEMNDNTRALLFAASRYEHQLLIKKWIDEGKIVISDRYIYSSLAYNTNTKEDKEFILNINKVNEIFMPDYVFYYKIDMKTYNKRKNKRQGERELDALEKEKDSFFEKALNNYIDAFEMCNTKYITIDANQNLEDCIKESIKNIEKILK